MHISTSSTTCVKSEAPPISDSSSRTSRPNLKLCYPYGNDVLSWLGCTTRRYFPGTRGAGPRVFAYLPKLDLATISDISISSNLYSARKRSYCACITKIYANICDACSLTSNSMPFMKLLSDDSPVWNVPWYTVLLLGIKGARDATLKVLITALEP